MKKHRPTRGQRVQHIFELYRQIFLPLRDDLLCPYLRPFEREQRQQSGQDHVLVEHKPDAEQRGGVLLTIDGQLSFELQPEDTIGIRLSPHCARLITAGRSAYYSALREKLAWNKAVGGNHA